MHVGKPSKATSDNVKAACRQQAIHYLRYLLDLSRSNEHHSRLQLQISCDALDKIKQTRECSWDSVWFW